MTAERTSLDALLDRALETGGETDGFDFKEVLDFQNNGEHRLRLLKAIGAFNNTDGGGYLIIGVSNDRRVVGLSSELAATYDQTPVQTLVNQYFAPSPTIQVRQHARDGKLLVIIEVAPFLEIPSIVRKYEVQGKEKLQDGTFLVRNGAAESAILTTEVELRKLCDAIAARRAARISELVERGKDTSSAVNGLAVIEAEAHRMRDHAEQLNAALHHGYARDYLPLLFRPALLESALVQVVPKIRDEKSFLRDLGVLRTSARAADEETERVLAGRGDVQRLRQLVLQVLNFGATVAATAHRMQ